MIRSALRPWSRESTWWSLVHLLCGLPLGYFFTVAIVVAFATTISTIIILPVGLLASWILFVAGHGMAQVERSRFAAFFGVDLSDPAPPADGTNIFTRHLARLTSAARWRELLYLILRLPVSAIEVVLIFFVWSGSLALLTLPLYVARLPERSADLGLISIGAGPSSWLVAIVGMAALVYLAPWTTLVIADAEQAFGRSLLAHGSRTEIEQTVVRLESSRAAALDSAEGERRRIERDLHDGAQQRLIAAAMDLGVAKERILVDPVASQVLVARAHDEVKAAMQELRDLVRGIHPVILEDRGLDAALSAVVARSAVPVSLSVMVEPRPLPVIESAAYFIVCETLTNVTRHAKATRATVEIIGDDKQMAIVITDDGVGGADQGRGSGLAGLAGRVASLGGRLSIQSPPGGPTRIEVEIPCGS